jgi:hypothetical protein
VVSTCMQGRPSACNQRTWFAAHHAATSAAVGAATGAAALAA